MQIKLGGTAPTYSPAAAMASTSLYAGHNCKLDQTDLNIPESYGEPAFANEALNDKT